MNIYLPDALGERIKKVRKGVNWSEVAQQAFEQKLGELAAIKTKPTMNDTIDRLRASKARVESTEKTQGRVAGTRWAKNQAEYDELKRVAGISATIGSSWGADCDNSSWPAKTIAEIASSGERMSRDEVSEWWEIRGAIDQIEEVTPGFCSGFLEGVEEVWDEVKDQV